MVAGCGPCFLQENVRPQIGLWATRTSSQINASTFNESKNGIKSIQSKFSQHILACYNRAGVTRQLLTQTGNRGSGENVSCTWRLHPAEILVLLKTYQPGYLPAEMFTIIGVTAEGGLGGNVFFSVCVNVGMFWHVGAKWGLGDFNAYRQTKTMSACTQSEHRGH